MCVCCVLGCNVCVCVCVLVCNVCVQDMYVLGSLIYLVMFAVENSAMVCLGRHMDPELVAAYDTLFCMMLGAVFIFCHLVFIIHVQITVRRLRVSPPSCLSDSRVKSSVLLK